MRFADLIDEIEAFAEQHRSLFLSNLSFQAAELANSMPVRKFLTLILEVGGRTTYIAQVGKIDGKLNPASRIARVLGKDAITVAHEYGGMHHVFPSPTSIVRSIRKFLVYDRYRSGQSINQITSSFDLNERTIRRDIAAARKMFSKSMRKASASTQEPARDRQHKSAKSQSKHIHASRGRPNA